ncbi:MAG: hypothetical protein RBT74_15610 [Tenuifilaceae bacterium]|jgi:endonuclease/exonuclease/phosphatase family metal-dependent hydrolase|nr:hypothetical protein [Tenuifilaceae bacterium]
MTLLTYAKAFNKPVYLAGDLNEQPHEEAIQKFKENNFIVLNDPATKTYPREDPKKLIDMILGYKTNSTNYNIVSRGIPNFPRVDLRQNSDHLPYYVIVYNSN